MIPTEEAYAIARKLEDEIARYGLQPGWRLPPEESLAQMHGVSRGVIRSAISILRERGLVASRRGGGTFVASVDVDAVAVALRGYVGRTETDKAFDELLHLRMLVEGECARELATKRRKEALTRLQESFDAMKRGMDSPAGFAKADFEFHRTMVNESGNGIFRAIMSALSGILEDYSKHSHTIVPDRRVRVLAEHEAILEAIQQGDGEAAAHLASAHVQRAKASLKAVRAKTGGEGT
jgi:DNA-binding FadR family transcriptional regulator